MVKIPDESPSMTSTTVTTGKSTRAMDQSPELVEEEADNVIVVLFAGEGGGGSAEVDGHLPFLHSLSQSSGCVVQLC